MAQHDYIIINQGFPAFRTDLNNCLNTIATANSGTTAPTTLYTGLQWLDTTDAGSDSLEMKFYDGADWITMYTIDTATNTIDYSDASVSMPGISTSATVTVLTLADGSMLLNPAGYVSVGGKATQAGEIRFLEDTDDGANYIALKGPTGYGSNVTYILPTVDGSDGDVLTTNALGTMSWTTPASGISAGFVIAMSIAL